MVGLPCISWFVRMFIPASWQLDEQVLGSPLRVPFEIPYELIREGDLPVEYPDEPICFDFLFTDGSHSCNQWLLDMLCAGMIHPVACLLPARSAADRTLPDFGLPRLACDFACPASWLPLLHAVVGVLDGLMHNCYGDIMEVLPRGEAHLGLIEINAENIPDFLGRVERWLGARIGTHFRSCILIIKTCSVEQASNILNKIEPLLFTKEEGGLVFQLTPVDSAKSPSVVILFRH